MTAAQAAAHEQTGKLSPAELHHMSARMPVDAAKKSRLKLADIDAAASTAISKMPLNDLLFMIASEVDRRAKVPSEECPFDPDQYLAWSHAANGIADNIRQIARRAEKRGIV
jgi:hypothetical protein